MFYLTFFTESERKSCLLRKIQKLQVKLPKKIINIQSIIIFTKKLIIEINIKIN